MLRATLVLMLVCMASAACNEMDPNISNEGPPSIYQEPPPSDGTITLADGTRQAISETKPMAGLYEFTTEYRDLSAGAQGVGDSIQYNGPTQKCLSEEFVQRGYEILISPGADLLCNFERFAIEDGKLNSLGRCVSDGRDLTFETTGTVGPEQSEWTTKVTGMDELGMTLNYEVKVTIRRIKDC